ncbi:UNVERIFIED_CONTAM: RNA demethylase ALKB [Sesamum radiatum]|uniref:RNA demethylase ALKB n=1 Tax=Sesamum radiatum TaxID=300843 RepID=A0AAW2UNF8_SESRA
MPPAAGVVTPGDRIPVKPMTAQQLQPPLMTAAASEAFAKDAIIAWFRGEFAAANAIIDALCNHLSQLEGGGGGGAAAYESAFAAIHRRRLNWIPILQMQKYYPIVDITLELKKVAEKKREETDVDAKKIQELGNGGCTSAITEEDKESEKEKNTESSEESNDNGGGEMVDEDGGGEVVDDSLQSEITDSGSQEVQALPEHVDICSNHEECEARRGQIKMTKGFVAKEPVNVVRGLKLYEDIFTDVELSKLNDFVNELRVAGRNGELSGETFILYNQQMKGNKRELIQLGVPIFGQIKEDATNKFQKSHIEPIPALLQGVIDHLIQWHLIRKLENQTAASSTSLMSIDHPVTASCKKEEYEQNHLLIMQGEYSQPFLKPPHLDQPLATLLLSQSTMAFGRALVSDSEGNYRGPLTLSLREGSDTARHAMCSSENKRASITFFRVRTETETNLSEITNPLSKSMTLWQSGVANPYTMPNNYEAMNMIPKWGLLRSPVVMFTPVSPAAVSPRRTPHGGTGFSYHGQLDHENLQSIFHHAPREESFLLCLPPLTHINLRQSLIQGSVALKRQVLLVSCPEEEVFQCDLGLAQK